MMRSKLLATVIISILIILSPFTAQSQQIVIDNISNTWDDGGVTRLIPNKNIDFTLRYINNSGFDISAISNGFRIWTTGGSPFTPLNGEILLAEFSNYFDALNSSVYSADGLGADTLSFLASALFEGTGLPIGFNELVLKLSTGGIQEGETLCIDSSWTPSGVWKWAAPGGITLYPSWSGPQCFLAECPACIGPTFTNCIDSLKIDNNSIVSYQFEAININIPSTYYFRLIDGPGAIDSVTGEWSYTVPPNKLGTYETLVVETYSAYCPCWESLCTVVLDYTSDAYGDLTGDGLADISDLVFLVDFMFTQGPPPTPYLSGDLNRDGLVDITDLVLLVDLLFGGGDPPEITNAPTSLTGSHCEVMTYDFDELGTNASWSVNIGTIDANGVWTYTPSLADVGQPIVLTVTASDYYDTSVDINLTFTNEAPVLDCIGLRNITSGHTITFEFSATDCDPVTFSVLSDGGLNATIDPNSGLLSVRAETMGIYIITIGAFDGILWTECYFEIGVVN